MALPTNADVIVVRGYWWDEATGQGVNAAITFDPVPLSGSSTVTPNLRDLTASGFVKTRSRVATPDAATGYFAAFMVSSNDPDLDAYAGRRVTFSGEPPFVVEVPHDASTTTVDSPMATATGLTEGSTVKAVWLADAALITTPTPAPSINYLTSSQTLSNIVDAVEAHDEDTGAHPDLRALISGDTQLLGWAYAQAFRLASATRNANSAITTASVVWPDGATGTFTTDTASSLFPGAIDAYHVTHVFGGTTKTITQTAVTRDAGGAVTAQPALTIA